MDAADGALALLDNQTARELTDAVRSLTRVLVRMEQSDRKENLAFVDTLKFIAKDVRDIHDVLIPLPQTTNGDAHKFEAHAEQPIEGEKS
jgi:hypothetical protein